MSRRAEAAPDVDVERLDDDTPGHLERVAMGGALVRDPKVFLFDEPLSNLDAKLRVQMRGEIRALHKRLGTTCIYVTHDQIEAMTMADRIVVMHDGVVEQAGSPLDLYDRPANKFVASFLGSPAMNFLSGRIRAYLDPAFVCADGTVLPLPPGMPARDDTAAICGVRPEAITLAPDSPVKMRIDICEPTGAETHVFGRFGASDAVAAMRQRVNVASGAEIGVAI